MKSFNYYSSSVSYKKLLGSYSVIKLISLSTNSNVHKVHRKVLMIRSAIKKWLNFTSLKTIAKRIKDSEKAYLLNGKTTWFSMKYVSGPGISDSCTKVLLSIHRNMRDKPVLDLKTISHVGKSVKQFLSKYSLEIKDVLKNKLFFIKHPGTTFIYKGRYWNTVVSLKKYNFFTCDPTIDTNFSKDGSLFPLQISTKGRANGDCFNSHDKDSCALQKSKLIDSVEVLWREWKYGFPSKYLTDTVHTQDCRCIPSKLLAISDKSCKSRVIAVLDNWSQVSLRPIHYMIERNLTRYRHDFTHDHMKGIKYLLNKKGVLSSVDLSSATDTIPAKLSLFILRRMIKFCVTNPNKIIKAVENLLINRDFYYRSSNKLKSVRYKTGQPMGAYSSFPLLAITNHFLALLSYRIVSGCRPDKMKLVYSIVGDDIVLGPFYYSHEKWVNKELRDQRSHRVRGQYILLCNELGIIINQSKTLVGNATYEFCRRFARDHKILSFPTWNSHYISLMDGDPYCLLDQLRSYNYELPSYRLLSGLHLGKRGYAFKRSILRSLVSQTDLTLDGAPLITRIPKDVISHGDRCLVIQDSLINNELRKVKTRNPFLKRLNYNIVIRNVFKRYSSKYNIWDLGLRVKANTFYLSYIETYLRSKSVTKKKRFYSKGIRNNLPSRIRTFTMERRHLWSSIVDKDCN